MENQNITKTRSCNILEIIFFSAVKLKFSLEKNNSFLTFAQSIVLEQKIRK